MTVQSRICKFIATLGPIGSLPMPGTLGTICAVPLLFLSRSIMHHLGLAQEQIFLLGLFFLFIWIVGQALKNFTHDDPSEIVLDEVLGYFVAMMAFPLTPLNLFLAFGFFRFFDIVKPIGIDQIERLDGAWGVVLDDVVAGVFAHLCVSVAIQIIVF